nr:MAG TPA: hypothetical protein [Caudoviricetes sp.]
MVSYQSILQRGGHAAAAREEERSRGKEQQWRR